MFNRFVLMSLCDMERLEIGNILVAAACLNAVSSEFSGQAILIRPGLAVPVVGATVLEELRRHCVLVAQTIIDELSGRKLYTLDRRHAIWFDDPSPFGAVVEDAFPSACFDIREAAKCRAVGRWTACVMHLMRVMEAGLGALAHHHDVPADANWNQVINQIEARIREVGKRSHGPEAEQSAAEAATHCAS